MEGRGTKNATIAFFRLLFVAMLRFVAMIFVASTFIALENGREGRHAEPRNHVCPYKVQHNSLYVSACGSPHSHATWSSISLIPYSTQ